MHLAIAAITFELPRRIHVPAGEWIYLVSPAIARWNALRPGLFSLTGDAGQADVFLERAASTWVEMPRYTPRSVVHWGPEPSEREYWFAHELGHTLGLGDHVWAELPGIDRYLNPHVDSIDDPDRYRGVMSYLSPPAEWFGEHDYAGIRALFPLERRAIIPGIAGGES